MSIKKHLQKSRKKSDHIISDLHSVVENKEGILNNGIHKSNICSSDSESEIETSNKSRKKVTLVSILWLKFDTKQLLWGIDLLRIFYLKSLFVLVSQNNSGNFKLQKIKNQYSCIDSSKSGYIYFKK